MDNASSHKSHKVKQFVSKCKDRLELLFLPPYSPDLNPIERVWKNLRYHVTHNIYFETLEFLENAILTYMPIDLAHKDNVPSRFWGYANDQGIQGAQLA